MCLNSLSDNVLKVGKDDIFTGVALGVFILLGRSKQLYTGDSEQEVQYIHETLSIKTLPSIQSQRGRFAGVQSNPALLLHVSDVCKWLVRCTQL